MGYSTTWVALASAALLIGAGCANRPPGDIRTQIVTFPGKGIVYHDGRELGDSPASITLPQDEHGRLIGRSVVQVVPRDEEEGLYPASRVFEPGQGARVPHRVMIDMSQYATTNFPAEMEANPVAPAPKPKPKLKIIERSKPTKVVVGVD